MTEKRTPLTVFLALFATVMSLFRQAYLPELEGDHIQTLAVALSSARHHGLTIPSLPLSDISQINFVPFALKPVGYPYLISLLFKIIPNLAWDVMILNLLGTAVFFSSWWMIFRLFDELDWRVEVFIWSAWAFIIDPLLKARPDELLALANPYEHTSCYQQAF
jgi:hypothetical protein